jgi:hypothetical protein
MLFGSLQGHIGCLTYQWLLVNWQQGERQRKLLWKKDCPSHVHFMLVVTRRLAVSFTMLEGLSERHSAFGERELGQRVMIACCDVMVLTTAVIGGDDYGKALGWQEG